MKRGDERLRPSHPVWGRVARTSGREIGGAGTPGGTAT